MSRTSPTTGLSSSSITSRSLATKTSQLPCSFRKASPTRALIGYYRKQTAGAEQAVKFRTIVDLNFSPDLEKRLAAAGIQPAIRAESNLFAQTVLSFLPIALFSPRSLFPVPPAKSVWPARALSTLANPKRACLARDKNKITFRDVAGVEEAKDEVQELVEFLLRDPKKFSETRGDAFRKAYFWSDRPGTGKNLVSPRHRRGG